MLYATASRFSKEDHCDRTDFAVHRKQSGAQPAGRKKTRIYRVVMQGDLPF
jgi:hypothetical protein